MIFNKNKYRISSIFFAIVLIFSLNACKNATKEANVATTEVAKTEHAEEETPTIATLSAEQIKTIGVQYGTIENKQLTAIMKANGSITVPNNNKANVTSLYGGVIKTLNVQIGSYVKKGQTIATIANPQFIQLQEEYLTLDGKIIYAEQEQQRQKELNTGNAGALKNLQQAEAELRTFRTRKASLEQQIRLMGINPNDLNNGNLVTTLTVSSPMSGTISTVFSKIGSYIDVASPVAEIVDNSQLHVDLNVFEKDLPMLKVGQTIHFKITNNPTNEYDATIFSIGNAFEPNTKTIPIHATVKGNKTGLIDGMNITALVSLNNVTTPAIPTEAIVSHEGQDFIFVLTDKKAEQHHEEGEKHKEETTLNFEKIPIAKGVSDLGYSAITPLKDLPKNAKVVTKGAFFILAKLTNKGEEE